MDGRAIFARAAPVAARRARNERTMMSCGGASCVFARPNDDRDADDLPTASSLFKIFILTPGRHRNNF